MDNLHLPLFLRTVRQALEISQTKLSREIGISQPSLAQYESLKISLSPEVLLKIASVLNISPDFILEGKGNPFKQNESGKIIKMLLPEDRLQKIDYSIILEIANASKNALFSFLKAPSIMGIPELRTQEFIRHEIAQWRKQLRQGVSICALFVQDSDSNTFLFKRKNNLLFNEGELVTALREIEAMGQKYFEIEIIRGFFFVKDIILWSDELGMNFANELNEDRHFENRRFILTLLDNLWTHKTLLTDQESYNIIRNEVRKMSNAELHKVLSLLIPQIAKVVGDQFQKNK